MKPCSVCGNSEQICYDNPEVNTEKNYFVCAMCSGKHYFCVYCPFKDHCADSLPEDCKDLAPEEKPLIDLDEPAEMIDYLILSDFLRVARKRADILKPEDYLKWIKGSLDMIGAFLEMDLTSGDHNAGTAHIQNI